MNARNISTMRQVLVGIAMLVTFACLLFWATFESTQCPKPETVTTYQQCQPIPAVETAFPQPVPTCTGEESQQVQRAVAGPTDRPTLAPPPALARTSYGQVIEVEVVVEQAPAGAEGRIP